MLKIGLFILGMGMLSMAQNQSWSQSLLVEGRSSTAADGSIMLSWPGNAVSGRFSGNRLGFVLEDGFGDYEVEIDGLAYPVLRSQKGQLEYEISDGLGEGEHSFRLFRRTEGGTSKLKGLVLSPGGQILEAPAPKSRHIEFLGDSYTVGYGIESGTVKCSWPQVRANTNHALAFPALLSQKYQAELHSIAVSGTGLVRNFGGKDPAKTFLRYFERSLANRTAPSWDLRSWKASLVVVGLGINDFSTPLRAEEGFESPEQFKQQWKQAYHNLLDTLRRSYGAVPFVLTAVPLPGGAQMAAVQEVVQEQQSAGYRHVYFAALPRPRGSACQGHPNTEDHQKFAQSLEELIDRESLWSQGLESYLGPVHTGGGLAQAQVKLERTQVWQ